MPATEKGWDTWQAARSAPRSSKTAGWWRRRWSTGFTSGSPTAPSPSGWSGTTMTTVLYSGRGGREEEVLVEGEGGVQEGSMEGGRAPAGCGTT